jgi:hypothetical protein
VENEIVSSELDDDAIVSVENPSEVSRSCEISAMEGVEVNSMSSRAEMARIAREARKLARGEA